MSNPNPLFPDAVNQLDGAYAVTAILAFLEDQAVNIADMMSAAPACDYSLSPQGVAGQRALYGLLRETLEQTTDKLRHGE